MLANIHHASTEQTATVRADLTLYASLELSRATWLVTCLLSERDRMSRYFDTRRRWWRAARSAGAHAGEGSATDGASGEDCGDPGSWTGRLLGPPAERQTG